MKNIQKLGGLSSFYLAFAYMVGILIFLVVLDYVNIEEPAEKVNLLITHTCTIYASNLLMYVLFGFVLLVFVKALYDRLCKGSPQLAFFASTVGIIWAGLLIASGMVSNAGIEPTVQLYAKDPLQAAQFWLSIETVANGLGGANGEILGGLMTLLFSFAAIRAGSFSRGLHYLGIVVGAIGIISTVPGMHDMAGLFALSQIVWFIWIGVALLKED